MKLSAYLYNLFMTVIILIFLLIAYLYYKINNTINEAFEDVGEVIDLSGSINIPGLNTNININQTIQNLQRMDLSGSTADMRDLLLNNEPQCKLFKDQIDTLQNVIESYRSTGDFVNLRVTYETIESIKEFMKTSGCTNV